MTRINTDGILHMLTTLLTALLPRLSPQCSSAVATLPLVDWTGTYTTGIKQAGFCMSGDWAFAIVEQLESDAIRVYGSAYNSPLSTQQLLACTYVNSGCSSGTVEGGIQYAVSNMVVPESRYPFTSYNSIVNDCNPSAGGAQSIGISAYFTQLSKSEACMARYVQTVGPILAMVAVVPAWYTYTGGIMTATTCPATGTPTTYVQLVGVDIVNRFWKVRGHWGSTWGERGHIRLAYGTNTCNLAYKAIYTTPMVHQ